MKIPLEAGQSVPPLSVSGLCKTFGTKAAVCDISFTVSSGEIVGLLGPNGAGKTTTISCIAGLHRPDYGTIAICGLATARHGRKARGQLGFAAEKTGLYESLDLVHNLRFYASLAGTSAKDLNSKVKWVIKRFQLGRLLDQPVGSLSAGEKRLAHVASAIVGKPQVVLLDEATANLDIEGRQLVLDAVKELAADGCAVLYSSHYLDEIEQICSSIVILRAGRIILDGPVPYLISTYGGGHVELMVSDQPMMLETADLTAALHSLDSIDDLRSARIVEPSLEAVFMTLTGERITSSGSTRPGC